jgi:hypothetical protein
MSEQKRKQREEIIVSAKGQVASAPTKNKAQYLNLPPAIQLFSPTPGVNYVAAFLPWRAGKTHPQVMFSGAYQIKPGDWVTNRFLSVHKRQGPNEENFLCNGDLGKACYVCERFGKVKNSQPPRGTPESKKYWNEVMMPLKPSDRELFFIHLLEGEGSENKKNLFLWDESPFLFGDAFRKLFTRRPGYDNYASPGKSGMNVSFSPVKVEKGDYEYVSCAEGIIMDKREEPLPDWLWDTIEKVCIDNYIKEAPYELMKSFYIGNGESTSAKSSTTVSVPKKKDEEVEENVDDDAMPAGLEVVDDNAPVFDDGATLPEEKEEEETTEEEEDDGVEEVTEEVTVEEEPEAEPEPPPPPVTRKPATKPATKPAATKPAATAANKPKTKK